MSVTEAERAGLVRALTTTIDEEPALTLMNCILPEGRDQLATKADVERHEAITEAGFALVDARFEKVDARFEKVDARFEKVDAGFEKVDAQFTEWRGHLELVLAKQTRTLIYMFAVFALTTWVSMAGVIIAFVSLAP